MAFCTSSLSSDSRTAVSNSYCLLGCRWWNVGPKVYKTSQAQCKWLHCNWLTWGSSSWLLLLTSLTFFQPLCPTSLSTGEAGLGVLKHMGLGFQIWRHSEVTPICYVFSLTDFGLYTWAESGVGPQTVVGFNHAGERNPGDWVCCALVLYCQVLRLPVPHLKVTSETLLSVWSFSV